MLEGNGAAPARPRLGSQLVLRPVVGGETGEEGLATWSTDIVGVWLEPFVLITAVRDDVIRAPPPHLHRPAPPAAAQ